MTAKEELKAKYIKEMNDIKSAYGWDEEMAHVKMDDCLCALLKELGFEEIVEIFESQAKWYA